MVKKTGKRPRLGVKVNGDGDVKSMARTPTYRDEHPLTSATALAELGTPACSRGKQQTHVGSGAPHEYASARPNRQPPETSELSKTVTGKTLRRHGDCVYDATWKAAGGPGTAT